MGSLQGTWAEETLPGCCPEADRGTTVLTATLSERGKQDGTFKCAVPAKVASSQTTGLSAFACGEETQ